MRCQQRVKRRCPRGSSDVPEADRAPPADAELLPESMRKATVTVGRGGFCSGTVHAP